MKKATYFATWDEIFGFTIKNCQPLRLNCQLLGLNCQLLGLNCQLLGLNCQLLGLNCQLFTNIANFLKGLNPIISTLILISTLKVGKVGRNKKHNWHESDTFFEVSSFIYGHLCVELVSYYGKYCQLLSKKTLKTLSLSRF